ncbi:MAG: hypothetical protein ACP5OA_06595 [Candidatus Woesearchaeota archaeon]
MKKLFTLILLLMTITTFANMKDSDSSSFFIDVMNPKVSEYTISGLPDDPDYKAGSWGLICWWDQGLKYSVDLNTNASLDVSPLTWHDETGFSEDQFRYSYNTMGPIAAHVTTYFEIKVHDHSHNVIGDCIFKMESFSTLPLIPINILNITKEKIIIDIPCDIAKSGCGRYYIMFK